MVTKTAHRTQALHGYPSITACTDMCCTSVASKCFSKTDTYRMHYNSSTTKRLHLLPDFPRNKILLIYQWTTLDHSMFCLRTFSNQWRKYSHRWVCKQHLLSQQCYPASILVWSHQCIEKCTLPGKEKEKEKVRSLVINRFQSSQNYPKYW